MCPLNMQCLFIPAAGGRPIQEHLRRQGRSLPWLLERCGNRYHVVTDRPHGASQAQVRELFEKIQKMMEANKRPREVQYRMYTQLRRDVSVQEERRRQGREEEVEMEMGVMYDAPDGRSRQRQQTASGWSDMPTGG